MKREKTWLELLVSSQGVETIHNAFLLLWQFIDPVSRSKVGSPTTMKKKKGKTENDMILEIFQQGTNDSLRSASEQMSIL